MSAVAVAAVSLLLAVALRCRPRLTPRQVAPSPRSTRRQRRRTATVDQWAACLDTMSNELRTGSSLSTAVQQAATRCQPHGRVLTAASTLADLTAAGGGTADPDEAVVLHAIRAAHALGGSMTATLDAASALLRERAVIRSEATAFSAQARLSARVLTGVPLAFAAWSAASSQSFRAALVSPIGLASALLGAACNLVGWWWMRCIVNKASA